MLVKRTCFLGLERTYEKCVNIFIFNKYFNLRTHKDIDTVPTVRNQNSFKALKTGLAKFVS